MTPARSSAAEADTNTAGTAAEADTAAARGPESSGRPAPAAPDTGLRVALASAAAVLACALSLHGVLEGLSWLEPLILTVAAVVGSGCLVRRFRAPLPLVPAAELAALALALTWLFLPDRALAGIVPTADTVRGMGALLDHAQASVATQVIPVLPEPGIVFLACLGIGLMAVLTDTLAVTLRMPAAAGLGLLAVLVVPAVIKPHSVGVVSFLLAGAAYLVVLAAAAHRDAPPSGPRRPPVAAAAVGAAALVLALILPTAVPGFTSGAFPQGARLQLWSGGTGLNPVVTLGNDLRQPTATGRITYATDSPSPLYLRSTTVEDFTGARWGPSPRDDERRRGVVSMTPAEAALNVPGDRTTTQVSSRSYSSPWLLAPYAATSVRGLEGAWSWDPQTMSIRTLDGGSSSGTEYEVRSLIPQVSREQLAALPPAPAEALDPVFTDLPAEVPQAVTDAAREVTADAVGPYQQALALQAYLRGPSFAYSLQAPVDGGYDGNGMAVLDGFMRDKSGYCIHFAAAMAVMARELGIPSRMALGYAPGRATGETVPGPDGGELRQYTVDARDAHAWPELYFEGAGWVRFEPTPSRGSVPAYARAAQAPSTVPRDADDAREVRDAATPAPQRTPAAPAETGSASPGAPAQTGQAPWLGVMLGLAVAAAALLSPWLLRRRRARRRAAAAGTAPAAAAWQETMDLGQDYGQGALTSDTPAGYARRLGAGLPAEAEAALTRLRAAYEQESYARAGSGPAGPRRPHAAGTAAGPEAARQDAAAQTLWEDVRRVRAGLDTSSGRLTRLRARLLPASLGSGRR